MALAPVLLRGAGGEGNRVFLLPLTTGQERCQDGALTATELIYKHKARRTYYLSVACHHSAVNSVQTLREAESAKGPPSAAER